MSKECDNCTQVALFCSHCKAKLCTPYYDGCKTEACRPRNNTTPDYLCCTCFWHSKAIDKDPNFDVEKAEEERVEKLSNGIKNAGKVYALRNDLARGRITKEEFGLKMMELQK